MFLNLITDYQLINEIRITTDAEANSANITVVICGGDSCCSTSSEVGPFDKGSMKILSESQLGDCATTKLYINFKASIDLRIKHLTTDRWKGKVITIHTSKALYLCLITKWLHGDDLTAKCEKQTSSG